MKFKIDQPSLHQALTILSRSVANHPQLPVLGNIKLGVTKKKLELAATDLQTGVNITLSASTQDEGETTVPAKVFTEFIASLPPLEVEGKLADGLLGLSCGAFVAEINCIGAEEFPALPQPEAKPLLALPTAEFISIIGRVAFAAAADEGRPILTGVLVRATDQGLVLTATDGYRMSQLVSPLAKAPDFKAVIPARSLAEVSRTAAAQTELEKIEMYSSEGVRQLIFALGNIVISTRLIEGDFPNTDKIIPSGFQTRAEIDIEELTKAVRVAQVFARDNANIVKLELSPKGQITLLANTKQIGKNSGKIDAVIEGKDNKIAFNIRYLLDVLGVLPGDRCEFTMTDPLKPGVFKSLADSKVEPNFFHLIMPVRVQE